MREPAPRTREQAIDRAATAYAECLTTCAQMTPREQAEAAFQRGGRYTVDELEDRIRVSRGMRPIHGTKEG